MQMIVAGSAEKSKNIWGTYGHALLERPRWVLMSRRKLREMFQVACPATKRSGKAIRLPKPPLGMVSWLGNKRS